MIKIGRYEISRDSTYLDDKYKVIDVLDNDLLLVVLRSEFEKANFPLQTYVIPDYETIERLKNMRSK